MITEKYELYVGLNDKITKKQEMDTLSAYKLCVNICKECTITEATGFYTHTDGTFTTEKSLKIELFGKTEKEVKHIAELLKKTLNQESVIINKVVAESEFI